VNVDLSRETARAFNVVPLRPFEKALVVQVVEAVDTREALPPWAREYLDYAAKQHERVDVDVRFTADGMVTA
jgi:hypothetical protein